MKIGLVIWVIVFSFALLGMALGRFLPKHHVEGDTKDVIKVSMAILGTMTALVLGFLVSNANASFSTRQSALVQTSANVVGLDGLLRRYGPEADPARHILQTYMVTELADMFPGASGRALKLNDQATAELLDRVEEKILAFKPADDRQRWLSSQALQLVASMSGAGWQLSDKSLGTIPLPFLIVVVAWLAILFASFGLFAPTNATVIVAFLLCSFAISSGLKIVLDLNTPFGGHVQISGFPLRMSSSALHHALDIISQPTAITQP